MAAGMASIPFTIVGSMFLIVSVLPQSFPALEGIWSASFDKIQNLYMLGNTATMGILALYFCVVFGYEYTKIQAQEEKIVLSPVNGALLSMMAFFMCLPQLVFEGGMATLVNVISDDQNHRWLGNGWRGDSFRNNWDLYSDHHGDYCRKNLRILCEMQYCHQNA